jgi:predicted ArsR family transcriptional regulator
VNVVGGHGLDGIGRLSSLDDPVRRQLYEYVASCDGPVARDDAAAAVGINRSLAAYHLDKLADAGILTISYSRPAGRSGPGAGRPTKRYIRTQQEVSASVPPRNYELVATLLAETLTTSGVATLPVRAARAARKIGRASASGGDVSDALRRCGYEPARTADGGIELRNCPFHRLAHEYTELVCGLNLQLIRGMLQAVGGPPRRAVPVPRDGRCCVAVRAAGPSRRKHLHRRVKTPHRQTDGCDG